MKIINRLNKITKNKREEEMQKRTVAMEFSSSFSFSKEFSI